MTEPRTPTGRALLAVTNEWGNIEISRQYLKDCVLAIEAEAEIEEPLDEPPGPQARSFHFIDVPVVDGVARLPDGRTIRSDGNVVRVPVLDDPS